MHYEPPDLTGAVLNQKYKLLKRVGWGGMGSVYATSSFLEGSEHKQRLAVKILNADTANDPEVVRRFVDEGRLCERLVHPNIVRVFEVAVAEDGCPYLVMEFLSGVPLAAYTAEGGKVPLPQAAVILKGILTGLRYAHEQGIVHRDLKPDNVYLAIDPEKHYAVKLLDFGIAKVMDQAGGMGKHTRTGVLLGTPAYMSPEQIRNAKDVDARSDLFSIGVLAYEMLTGKPAFPAPTEYAKLAAVLTATPTPLGAVDPSLDVLTEFVARAMQKDREHRFQSAEEMQHALAVALGEKRAATGAMPLSRLPEMPVHPNQPASVFSSSDADGRFETIALPQIVASPPATLRTPEVVTPPPQLAITAASASPRPAVKVPMQTPLHRPTGTLPSHDLPMLEPIRSSPEKAPARNWTWLAIGGLLLLLLGVGMGLLAASLQR